MILLRANDELRETFERMIGAMKAPVEWNGIFAVIDNYIILQGEVRSLFFHFDTRKTTTNIIDIPVAEEQTVQIGDNVCLQNVINMVLYVFGKWGAIEGIKVNKDIAELNRLFTGILRELSIEPDYTWEHFRFYQGGIGITYEDVVGRALIREQERMDAEDEKSSGGLWRRMIWKRRRMKIRRAELSGGQDGGMSRLGHNFYATGNLCPVCENRLHMAVYPEGKEVQIETDEGGVLLARACTCQNCQSFYTPVPGRLIGEGEVYLLEFADDRTAYEDYLGLLGRNGEKTSNYNYNEYADPKKRAQQQRERELESLEESAQALNELPEEELEKIVARMEEGFYPEESVARYGERIRERLGQNRTGGSKRAETGSGEAAGQEGPAWAEQPGGTVRNAEGEQPERPAWAETGAGKTALSSGSRESGGAPSAGRSETIRGAGSREDVTAARRHETSPKRESSERQGNGGASGKPGNGSLESSGSAKRRGDRMPGTAEDNAGRPASAGAEEEPAGSTDRGNGETPEQEHTRKKYEARMQMLDRYSDRQLRGLKHQLDQEKQLIPAQRDAFLSKVKQRLSAGLIAGLTKKADACADKTYAVIKRVYDEIEAADLMPEQKAPLRERLTSMMQRQAAREVEQLVRTMPAGLDRARYQTYLGRIRSYEGVDLTPYEERLNKSREAAERQEIANLVKRARKISREDLTGLIEKLENGDFLPELYAPYVEKTKEKIKELDMERIAEFCPNPMQMTFEEGMEAYEKISQGDFLPELKKDTLRSLTKRLQKVKTDECELLVQKLSAELAEAGIGENARHHFYPARKVMLKQAAEQETGIFDYAMACYAADRGLFEYPILLVDTARGQSGKEGMILTPDHLFYSTMLNAYGIPVTSIAGIRASTGLLNRGVTVVEKNGTKTKIPYAVDTKELTAYANVLDEFVRYLQEKPDSRKLTYLAKEHHDTICCFRCGFEYQGGSICPKCGYQNNG